MPRCASSSSSDCPARVANPTRNGACCTDTVNALVEIVERAASMANVAPGSPRLRLMTAYEWSRPSLPPRVTRTRTTSGESAVSVATACAFSKRSALPCRAGRGMSPMGVHWAAAGKARSRRRTHRRMS